MRSIVIVTQYYPPETGGGALRSEGIAKGLENLDFKVTVIAPQPSYMLSSSVEKTPLWKIKKETHGKTTVYRSVVYATDRKGFFSRLIYYFSFTLSAIFTATVKIRQVDYVLTISPPLFTGIVGIFIKKLLGAKMIFDIGDLWPESAIQLGFLTDPTLIRLSRILEKRIYHYSDLVNVVTPGTLLKIKRQNQSFLNLYCLPNFVDTTFISKQTRDTGLEARLNLSGKRVFGYIGNIGGAQGIEIILRAAVLLSGRTDIVFLIIGDGIEKNSVENYIRAEKLSNIVLLPPVEREKVNSYLSLFDFSIIPLVQNELFQVTVPSKLYECMAAEIPVLLCVDGEARELVEISGAGEWVEPENFKMLVEKILYWVEHFDESREMGKKGRIFAGSHFERDKLMEKFRDFLISRIG